MKRPKRGRPLTIADLLLEEAKIPPERGGPFCNVQRALDGTSADNPRLRRILAKELTAFTASVVQKEHRRVKTGTDNLARHARQQQRKEDAKALEAVKVWRNVNCRRLSDLSQTDAVQKYLNQRVKPPRRQAARLRSMLKDGRIK